jgi:hypothetical protein
VQLSLRFIFWSASAICFVLAAFNVLVPRLNLQALGLLFLTLGEAFR